MPRWGLTGSNQGRVKSFDVVGRHEEDPAFGGGHPVDGVQKAAEGQTIQALVSGLKSWTKKVKNISASPYNTEEMNYT